MEEKKKQTSYLSDEQEKFFSEPIELFEFFENQKKNDVWKRPFINEIILSELENAPILMDSLKETHNLECSEETILDTMSGTRLLISCPGETSMKTYPVRKTAFTSLCERAGLEGRAITYAFKNQKDVIVDILNRGFGLWSKNSQILIRDEKVSAVHSQDYVVLPTILLLRTLKEVLDMDFPGWRLVEAVTSHSSTFVKYNLGSKKDEILRPINRALKRNGHEPILGDPILLFSTSDTASSGANLYPYIRTERGIDIRIGEPLVLRHDGNADIEEFRQNAENIFSLYMDSSKRLEELSAIPIQHPTDCLIAIAQKMHLSKNATIMVAEEMELEWDLKPTALDVYMALWRIPVAIEAKTKEAAINNQEAVARTLKLDFTKYDTIYKWI